MPVFKKLYMKQLILLPILLFATSVFAQYHTNQNKIWAFGKNAGLDFNSGSPTPISTNIDLQEGGASVSDASGNLLFYTDGKKVYNKTGAVMPSGGDIVPFSPVSSSQGALVAPVIGSSGRYYVFSLEQSTSGNTSKLAYSIVNMAMDGGLGDVEGGSTPVADTLGEKMIAVTGNNNNIWLLVHKRDTAIFLAYEITASGVSATPVVSVTGTLSGALGYAIGVIKASPDRRKIVSQTFAFSSISAAGTELYDFDPTTGVVSNCKVLDSVASQYGAAFSPDNSKLYVQQHVGPNEMRIYQYDVSSSDAATIRASKTSIAKITTYNVTDLKLAPDDKIYMFGTDDSTKALFLGYSRFLDCINTPNMSGTLCGYIPHAIELVPGTGMRAGFPNLYVTSDTAATSVGVVGTLQQFTIFPNPAGTQVTITAPATITNVSICNAAGAVVHNQTYNSGTVRVDIGTLPAGVYFVHVNELPVRKLVKQ